MHDQTTISHIDFWDVGQGDCSVIHYSDKSISIIDVGPARSPLVGWLKSHPKRIRHLLLTHNDADHAGALSPLLADQGQLVESLWMLADRPAKDARFQAVFRFAFAWEQQFGKEIQQPASGITLWSSAVQKVELKIVHPSFSALVQATTPNKKSTMVVLEQGTEWLKVWPGDLELETVVRKCSGKTVVSLFGPHHGGPSDLLGTPAKFRATDGAQTLKLERSFLSVGSNNQHKHPNPSFVFSLAKAGTHVVCSQLTKACDPGRCKKTRPVFPGSAALGLPSAPTGVQCRGSWRAYLRNGALVSDQFDRQHLMSLAKLKNPLCLKGRGWKRGDDPGGC